MSKVYGKFAVALGAASVALFALTGIGQPADAASRKSKSYCERVCVDGACFYSCAETQRTKYQRGTFDVPQRQAPVKQVAPDPAPPKWVDAALNPIGGGGGGGGGAR